jgi:hypothetical protein
MRFVRVAAVASMAVLVMAGPAQAQKFDYKGSMNGPEVVPGPGDPDGTGTFGINIDNASNQLCYDLAWQNIDQPNAAHIHVGSPNQAGQIMVDLNLPANGPKACIPVDSTSVGHMTGGPKAHYVDLHTPSLGEGAIRGQMQK